MKLLKKLLRILFQLFAIGASVYAGYHCPELILTAVILMLVFLAVWAFSSDEKP